MRDEVVNEKSTEMELSAESTMYGAVDDRNKGSAMVETAALASKLG